MKASFFFNNENAHLLLCPNNHLGFLKGHTQIHLNTHVHTHTAYRSGRVAVVGRASSKLIKSSEDRGRAGCLPAIFSSPALPMAAQLSLQIQIAARDTDIYNSHSHLTKYETLGEQTNYILHLSFSIC